MRPEKAKRRERLQYPLFVALLSVTSGLLTWYWWREATMEMTSERLAHYCGDQPECYPEWGFLFGAILLAPVAFMTTLVLAIHLGSVALERVRGDRLGSE